MAVEQAPAGGAEFFGEETWMRLLTFARMLEQQGDELGLIGPRELDRLWSRHILNSLAPKEFIPRGARVADIGSGAGFPGIVLAVVRPDVSMTLVESMERRTEWLREVADTLALDNVEVRTARAEDLHGHATFDIVTARAVAALKKLVPLTLPLVRPGGSLLALKGQRAADEIDAAALQLRKYGADWADIYEVVPFGTNEHTHIVEVAKVSRR